MDDSGIFFKMLFVGFAIVQLISWLAKQRSGAPAPPEQPHVPPKQAKKAPAATPHRKDRALPPAASAFRAPKPADDARRKLLERLDRIEKRANELAAEVRLERPNRRFADTLGTFVPQQIAGVRDAVRLGNMQGAGWAADAMELVVAEIQTLIRQRRDPELLPQLGDADAFADACYAPVMAFARAEGLPLTSGYPATQLTDFDLAIWTGFIPTSIAPIFLPADFFANARRWPAIAHEIGHDFLASVEGLEPALRNELFLPSAAAGTRPLSFEAGFDASDLTRIFGAWFEEIFCDVFGTLMCGPAYVVTMVDVFAEPWDPRRILMVFADETGRRYDTHPPSHLRVMIGCTVLDRAGFHTEANDLWALWVRRHGNDEEALGRVLFPAGAALLALPISLYADIARDIVSRLYGGPLRALSGFGLQDISGLDYGPHEHNEALRARDFLLAGQVPSTRDPRAVIAGAVLATQQRPEQELSILIKARNAIPAVGTSEVRPDAFAIAEAPPAAAAGPGAIDSNDVVEALVLREVLLPPLALRGRRPKRIGL